MARNPISTRNGIRVALMFKWSPLRIEKMLVKTGPV
jgi:hypothetical protein